MKENPIVPTAKNQQVPDGPAVYEFRIAQSLSDKWESSFGDWFDGMALKRDDQGNTILRGTLLDQSALHGVLGKIRDLNLVLLSVQRK